MQGSSLFRSTGITRGFANALAAVINARVAFVCMESTGIPLFWLTTILSSAGITPIAESPKTIFYIFLRKHIVFSHHTGIVGIDQQINL